MSDLKQRLYPNTIRVLNRIIEAPATVGRIAQDLHLSVSAVERAVNFLYEQPLIHIGKSARSARGEPARVFAAGAGRDAARITPLTDAEKAAAYRARGGDTHRARTLKHNARCIAASSTLAGMLGVKR